jgi:hypothetical protein
MLTGILPQPQAVYPFATFLPSPKHPANACPVYDFFTRASYSGVPWGDDAATLFAAAAARGRIALSSRRYFRRT